MLIIANAFLEGSVTKLIGSTQNQFLQTAFNQDEYELSK